LARYRKSTEATATAVMARFGAAARRVHTGAKRVRRSRASGARLTGFREKTAFLRYFQRHRARFTMCCTIATRPAVPTYAMGPQAAAGATPTPYGTPGGARRAGGCVRQVLRARRARFGQAKRASLSSLITVDASLHTAVSASANPVPQISFHLAVVGSAHLRQLQRNRLQETRARVSLGGEGKFLSFQFKRPKLQRTLRNRQPLIRLDILPLLNRSARPVDLNERCCRISTQPKIQRQVAL